MVPSLTDHIPPCNPNPLSLSLSLFGSRAPLKTGVARAPMRVSGVHASRLGKGELPLVPRQEKRETDLPGLDYLLWAYTSGLGKQKRWHDSIQTL